MTERDRGKRRATKSTAGDERHDAELSNNLSACVVQASRHDRSVAPTGPGAVERVWIMSRPPPLGRGVEPTVTSRRAYVMLSHIQGQMIDEGELVCKKVCTMSGGGANKEADAATATNPSCPRGGNGNCD